MMKPCNEFQICVGYIKYWQITLNTLKNIMLLSAKAWGIEWSVPKALVSSVSARKVSAHSTRIKTKTSVQDYENLTKNALEKGYLLQFDNPGGGNCMFYALVDQLRKVHRVDITHEQLRENLVQYLKENPTLVSKSCISLCCFKKIYFFCMLIFIAYYVKAWSLIRIFITTVGLQRYILPRYDTYLDIIVTIRYTIRYVT